MSVSAQQALISPLLLGDYEIVTYAAASLSGAKEVSVFHILLPEYLFAPVKFICFVDPFSTSWPRVETGMSELYSWLLNSLQIVRW